MHYGVLAEHRGLVGVNQLLALMNHFCSHKQGLEERMAETRMRAEAHAREHNYEYAITAFSDAIRDCRQVRPRPSNPPLPSRAPS